MNARCFLPPSGWCCTRNAGHEGPCAASLIENYSTGWASPTLSRAYDEIAKLRDDLAQPTESGISEALKRAIAAIEDADIELEGIA